MKNLRFLVSPAFMGFLFVILAAVLAAATFIGNRYGQDASYSLVYNTRWFELILLLLSVNLVGQLVAFRLFRRSRITGAMFHLAFILILAGAAITRYTGWEGSMHIREGNEQNRVLTGDKYISLSISDKGGKTIASGSSEYSDPGSRFAKTLKTADGNYKLELDRIVSNAFPRISGDPSGEAVISFFVVDSTMAGENVTLKRGEIKEALGVKIGFDALQSSDINISTVGGKFYMTPMRDVTEVSMIDRSTDSIPAGEKRELSKMLVISTGQVRIIASEMSESAVIVPASANPADRNTGENAMVFTLHADKGSITINLWEKLAETSSSATVSFEGKLFEVTYGSNILALPFSLTLNDFILERYPGSSSPSGYKSRVVLRDKNRGIEKPYVIYMNNILRYRGYRFYQSSFDRDEKGTVLSVNHDIAGMVVTYSGYGLLFLFIVLTLFNRNSVFHTVTPGHWSSNIRKTVVASAFFLLFFSGRATAQQLIPGKQESEELGKVLVQDQKGRTKPLFTLGNDILRKVTRENKFEGLTPMQVFLGFYLDFEHWKDVPLITVSSPELRSRLGIRRSRASFTDIVDLTGSGTYKLSSDVETAYKKAPGQRDKMDKEIMKVDERVNILYMISRGDFMKMFPLRDGSHDWGTIENALEKAEGSSDSLYLGNIIPALAGAIRKGDLAAVKQISESIRSYQDKFSGYPLPSESKTGAEMLYYRLNIFEKLFPFYATAGVFLLVVLVTMVITGKKGTSLLVRLPSWLLFAGFLFHTFGLATRWYISGHSPMSNGYESMIFISWVTLLAGFIFSRRSAFTLSATAVLASMTLMVAHLSFMDPEITNLVPVLKSYWLTLHVSVITGSYGFLGLGAVLSLIVLILLALSGERNRERISATIDELTVINYKTLTLGLYFLTTGTFLGAVWANESWGRYWGWDPKETWSLITIIVYSLVIHSRIIPGMKDIFLYNLLSLFAFSSVLMTYFGVNYYLSGLHSYAGGEAAPVPASVYITIVVLAALSFVAYSRYQKLKEKS